VVEVLILETVSLRLNVSPRGDETVETVFAINQSIKGPHKATHGQKEKTHPSTTTAVRVHLRGVLSNGVEVAFDTGGAPEVGTLRPGGWWVKGKLKGGELLLSRGKGYTVENIVVPALWHK